MRLDFYARQAGLAKEEVDELAVGEVYDYINCFLIFQGALKEDIRLSDEEVIPDWR